VSYAGVGLANISEIHRLGLDNSTQHDNTCLTGPAVQITGETKCFGKGKNCANLVKGAKAPNRTYFACQSGIHTCYAGGDCVLVFLVPDLDILPGTEVAQYLNQQTEGQTYFWQDPISSQYFWESPWQEQQLPGLLPLVSNKSSIASYLNKSVRI
jgi:hypothetical protein